MNREKEFNELLEKIGPRPKDYWGIMHWEQIIENFVRVMEVSPEAFVKKQLSI